MTFVMEILPDQIYRQPLMRRKSDGVIFHLIDFTFQEGKDGRMELASFVVASKDEHLTLEGSQTVLFEDVLEFDCANVYFYADKFLNGERTIREAISLDEVEYEELNRALDDCRRGYADNDLLEDLLEKIIETRNGKRIMRMPWTPI